MHAIPLKKNNFFGKDLFLLKKKLIFLKVQGAISNVMP